MTHGFRRFSPWLLACCFWPREIMVEGAGMKHCSPHNSQEVERQKEKGQVQHIPFKYTLSVTSFC